MQAALGRGGAWPRLCDWARLSLYGLQDGRSCQTVICQSLAGTFKPEHKRGQARDWCKGLSEMSVMFQRSTNNPLANFASANLLSLFGEQRRVLCFHPKSAFLREILCHDKKLK